MSTNYRVNLEMFEGPMDLLLYLIKKNDLDVYDIPISFITDEYLKYLNTLKELNIDVASEFLEMAAELAHIKSKLLLPQEGAESEEEEADPRADLVRRLIEYQRYKEAAAKLNERPILFRDVYSASVPKEENVPAKEVDFAIEGNAYLLLEAFNTMLAKMPKEMIKAAPNIDRISVAERIVQILDRVKFNQTVPLFDLMPSEINRHVIVVSFLALLEMAVMKMIKIFQAGRNEPIYLTCLIQNDSVDEQKKLIKLRDAPVVEQA